MSILGSEGTILNLNFSEKRVTLKFKSSCIHIGTMNGWKDGWMNGWMDE